MSYMGFKENEYLLQFDFKWNNEMTPVQFVDPEDIIVAYHLNEIETCFQRIEQVINNGKYVAGYMSYEACYAFHGNLTINVKNKMPLLLFGVFNKRTKLTEQKRGNYKISNWTMEGSKCSYFKHFQKIMKKIEQGCFEQINYTVPFHANLDRKSTRLNSSHVAISYAVFCLKKKI